MDRVTLEFANVGVATSPVVAYDRNELRTRGAILVEREIRMPSQEALLEAGLDPWKKPRYLVMLKETNLLRRSQSSTSSATTSDSTSSPDRGGEFAAARSSQDKMEGDMFLSQRGRETDEASESGGSSSRSSSSSSEDGFPDVEELPKSELGPSAVGNGTNLPSAIKIKLPGSEDAFPSEESTPTEAESAEASATSATETATGNQPEQEKQTSHRRSLSSSRHQHFAKRAPPTLSSAAFVPLAPESPRSEETFVIHGNGHGGYTEADTFGDGVVSLGSINYDSDEDEEESNDEGSEGEADEHNPDDFENKQVKRVESKNSVKSSPNVPSRLKKEVYNSSREKEATMGDESDDIGDDDEDAKSATSSSLDFHGAGSPLRAAMNLSEAKSFESAEVSIGAEDTSHEAGREGARDDGSNSSSSSSEEIPRKKKPEELTISSSPSPYIGGGSGDLEDLEQDDHLSPLVSTRKALRSRRPNRISALAISIPSAASSNASTTSSDSSPDKSFRGSPHSFDQNESPIASLSPGGKNEMSASKSPANKRRFSAPFLEPPLVSIVEEDVEEDNSNANAASKPPETTSSREKASETSNDGPRKEVSIERASSEKTLPRKELPGLREFELEDRNRSRLHKLPQPSPTSMTLAAAAAAVLSPSLARLKNGNRDVPAKGAFSEDKKGWDVMAPSATASVPADAVKPSRDALLQPKKKSHVRQRSSPGEYYSKTNEFRITLNGKDIEVAGSASPHSPAFTVTRSGLELSSPPKESTNKRRHSRGLSRSNFPLDTSQDDDLRDSVSPSNASEATTTSRTKYPSAHELTSPSDLDGSTESVKKTKPSVAFSSPDSAASSTGRKSSEKRRQSKLRLNSPPSATSSPSEKISGSIKSASSPDPSSANIFNHEELISLGRLGKGASGIVYKALHVTALRLVAVKSVPVFDIAKRGQMTAEVAVLLANRTPLSPVDSSGVKAVAATALSSSSSSSSGEEEEEGATTDANSRHYVVELYDAFTNPSDSTINIVLEWMDGGSLQDLVDSRGALPESFIAVACRCVIRGLGQLHTRRQLHRDIKPANLLFSRANGIVKLSDFGVSHTFGLGSVSKAQTFVGSLSYMAPERVLGQGQDQGYSYASDIWSVGLTAVVCATGVYPFEKVFKEGGYWGMVSAINDSESPTLLSHDQVRNDPNLEGQKSFSPELCDFVNVCLKKSPTERPSAQELLKHPFLFVSFQSLEEEDEYNKKAIEEACALPVISKDGTPVDGGETKPKDWSKLDRLIDLLIDFHRKKRNTDTSHVVPTFPVERVRLLASQLGLASLEPERNTENDETQLQTLTERLNREANS